MSGYETWSTGQIDVQLFLPWVRFTQNHRIVLREIECIEFECNKFVLVLDQIDLIHFEHSICISST